MALSRSDTAYSDLHKTETGEVFHWIVENSAEGVVVIRDARIVYTNPAAKKILGSTTPETLQDCHLPPDLLSREDQGLALSIDGIGVPAGKKGILRIITTDGKTRFIVSRNVPGVWDGGPATICFISDTTETKDEQLLREEHHKNLLISSITRHGIANQLMVLRRTLKHAWTLSEDPELLHHFHRIGRTSQEIFHQLESARMFQEMNECVRKWSLLEDILNHVTTEAESAGIKCSVDISNLEILAHALIPHVFMNLLDNTIRHGCHAAHISITSHNTVRGMIIVWEDDGIGIPAEEKELIFTEGYGKNTGLGLFLCREILAITDITIRETGMQDQGARFEILVPLGKFREAEGRGYCRIS